MKLRPPKSLKNLPRASRASREPKPAPRSKEELDRLGVLLDHQHLTKGQSPTRYIWSLAKENCMYNCPFSTERGIILWANRHVNAISKGNNWFSASVGSSMAPTFNPKDSWNGRFYSYYTKINSVSELKRGIIISLKYTPQSMAMA
ncbi:Uu.00g067630.m01.CDS01 [Anthostomella pinea]|uniref:Uu.00g067630.m01.CDS01 n=1 Tax=Anthostomella pinea TaxID=933095 RepID=A0AAI8VU67_9PEZI|nr:Uu.00g067630.m01.CDS01 [Anthostomella pinea]